MGPYFSPQYFATQFFGGVKDEMPEPIPANATTKQLIAIVNKQYAEMQAALKAIQDKLK